MNKKIKMEQKIEKIKRINKCGSCGEDFEEEGEKIINLKNSWENFKKNEWCNDCKRKNPQAYFYRGEGGHEAD